MDITGLTALEALNKELLSPSNFGRPSFQPRKHTVMSYAAQRREAKKRRNIRKRAKK